MLLLVGKNLYNSRRNETVEHFQNNYISLREVRVPHAFVVGGGCALYRVQSTRRGFRRAPFKFYVAYLRCGHFPHYMGHFRVGNVFALFPFTHREYGVPEAVQAQLRSQRAHRKTRKTGVVAHPNSVCFLDSAQLGFRNAVLHEFNRRRNFNSYQSVLFGVRYDLHSVFLPLPDLDDEEQMLRFLPHIQLGLRNDVYSRSVHKKRVLHFDIPACFGALNRVGDFVPQIPATLLQKHQRGYFLRELQGKAVQTQEAVAEFYQKNQHNRKAQKRITGGLVSRTEAD